jgi:hypothetical protein
MRCDMSFSSLIRQYIEPTVDPTPMPDPDQSEHKVSPLAEVADEIGYLRSEISALQQQLREAEAEILEDPTVPVTVLGNHYRVTVSRGITTRRVDWKKVAEKLNPSRQLVSAHTRTSLSNRISVTALPKD